MKRSKKKQTQAFRDRLSADAPPADPATTGIQPITNSNADQTAGPSKIQTTLYYPGHQLPVSFLLGECDLMPPRTNHHARRAAEILFTSGVTSSCIQALFVNLAWGNRQILRPSVYTQNKLITPSDATIPPQATLQNSPIQMALIPVLKRLCLNLIHMVDLIQLPGPVPTLEVKERHMEQDALPGAVRTGRSMT